MRALRWTVLLLLFASGECVGRKKAAEPAIGQKVSDFSLRNINGRMVSLSDYRDAKGFIIVFTCNHCPFAKLYTERLNHLSQKYTPKGVPMLAINPMDTLVYEEETYELMQERARTEHYVFPYLQDASQQVGKEFRASHTPHAFVIWKEKGDWVVRYAGAIDDNGSEPLKAHSYIIHTVDELLAAKPVTLPQTLTLGCAINYR